MDKIRAWIEASGKVIQKAAKQIITGLEKQS